MTGGGPRALDMARYPRRAHFDYFRQMACPYVGVTCEVDVTGFAARTRAAGRPFFLTFLWHAARAANAVPALRQRIRGAGIVEYPVCGTSHTVARPDGTYGYCALPAGLPLAEFLPLAAARQEAARTGVGLAEDPAEAEGLLFVSTVPGLSYTALVQPVPAPADSNPRLTWGRFRPLEGRLQMPVSLLCHHGLADGLHLTLFYEALARELAEEDR